MGHNHVYSVCLSPEAQGLSYLLCFLFFEMQANDPDSGSWGEVKYTIYGSGSDL